jgi:hypothetical protein
MRLGLLLFVALNAISQPHDLFRYDPEKYVIYKVSMELDIDGKLDDRNWIETPWTSDFVDIEGDIRPDPFYRTRAKMLWDDEYLYIAAELLEEDIWATYDQRDMVIFHENDFEVFIDPTGDTHNYYELEINALGTVWDLFLTKPYRDQGIPLDAWDITGLKSAVSLNGTLNEPNDRDSSWTVELAIPWKILVEAATGKRRPRDGDQWRVNFSRVQWKIEPHGSGYKKQIDQNTGKSYAEYNWVWSPQGAINMHQPETWGFVQFSEEIVSSKMKANIFKDSDDEIKWMLRQVYYKQRSYYQKNNVYAKSLDLLGLTEHPFDEVELSTTKKYYQASYQGKWVIQSDGKIFQLSN